MRWSPHQLAYRTAKCCSFVLQAGLFLPHFHRSVSTGRLANDSGALQRTADEVAYGARVTSAECPETVGLG